MSEMSTTFPRHWWGKIIGAILGLLKGGISGAFIGGLIGHFVDRLLAGFTGAGDIRRLFFRTLFATLGHVNKADGRVTEAEIQAAEGLMRRMQLSAPERQQAIHYFRAGKAPDFALEAALREFAHHTVMRHDLRQMFMEILLEAAAADGRISEREQAVLVRVCHHLRIPPEQFAAMWNVRYGPAGGGAGYRRARTAAAAGSLQQAYAALGLETGASDAEVKRAYRKLVRQYHPDKLVSQGLPEEMMEMAKKRVREINTAYDLIKQTRGIK